MADTPGWCVATNSSGSERSRTEQRYLNISEFFLLSTWEVHRCFKSERLGCRQGGVSSLCLLPMTLRMVNYK